MQILVGDEHINCTPVRPYDDGVCDLLDAWSQEIRGMREAREYPDVMTFAFFIRRGSVVKKKNDFLSSHGGRSYRLGRGLAFHIAPSNVPVNCMYTLVFGLLSGCANIVRVPSKEFPQVDILCRALSNVLKKHKFSEHAERIQVLRYDRDEKNLSGMGMTEFFSSICDVRVIWGGDATVESVRRFPIGTRAKEITFPDRYSFGIIDAQSVREASDDELRELARGFYNDTYLMDQNACSSPHLIVWSEKNHEAAAITEAQDRFWEAVAAEAEKYDLADIKVSDKYADVCELAGNVASVKKYHGNLVYVCDVDELGSDPVEKLRGRYGTFFQYVIKDIDKVIPVMDNKKVQTCAVYGIDPGEVKDLVIEKGLEGVDRVVPFGKTLDIDVFWDGYDLIGEMSRVVSL